MDTLNISNKLRSVHPRERQIYKFRFLYALVTIAPMFSALHEANLGLSYFLVYAIAACIYPHISFLLTCLSRDPERYELNINQNLDIFLIPLWAPIVNFNPMIMILIFMTAGMSGIINRRFVVRRFFLYCIIMGVAGIFFGFEIDTAPNLSTIICAGIAIIIFSYATLYILNRTSITINSTRKQLKEQKKELEKSLSERDRAYRMLNDELRVAESYVRNMLPMPIDSGWVKTDWLFVPSAILGGDAFGYHWLDNDHFAFYLLDVSGHGVGAALLSVSVLNALRAQSLKNADFKRPHQVLEALNASFPSENHDDMFFTIWYGVFNRNNHTLKYSSAGHPPAILLDENNSIAPPVTLLKCPNCIIGGLPETNFTEEKLQIQNESSLYLYSDGVYEVKRPDGSMWRFDDFLSYLKYVDTMEETRINRLYTHVRDLKGAETLDDDFSIMELVFVNPN